MFVRKTTIYLCLFALLFVVVSLFPSRGEVTETIENIDNYIQSPNTIQDNMNLYLPPQVQANNTYVDDETTTANDETEYENTKDEIKEIENTEEIEIEPLELEEVEESTEEKLEELEEDIPEETNENYTAKYVPSNNSFKSYMSYKAITSKSSPQYKLQQQAYTGEYGIRMIGDRYCIALGSFYTTTIGTKVDVVMENGNILKCILGDQKANIHTDKQNIRARDGSVVEFLIDKRSLNKTAKIMGDLSHADNKFSGEILEIRVYQ